MSDATVILFTAPPPGARGDDVSLTKIDGRESVMRAMELFANRPGVAGILLTIDAKHAELYKQKVGSHLMFMGIKLVQSGPTWIEQMRSAKDKLGDAPNVLVHDAARPAVAYTDLDALVASFGKYPALGLAIRISGQLLRAAAVPGPAKLDATNNLAELAWPVLFQKPTFLEMCDRGTLPEDLQTLEGSPLNARVNPANAGYIKAMLAILPKPKIKPPSSPFEEAQW